METAEARTKCPGCDNDVVIERNWTPGGINDSGGYVLQCEKCNHIFAFHLGKDINDSRVLRGAKKLDTYDDELARIRCWGSTASEAGAAAHAQMNMSS